MIVDKIQEYIKSSERRYLDPEFMGTYMEDLTTAFRRQYFDAFDDRRTLRLSSIGKCLRSQAYTILNYPSLPWLTPKLKMLLHKGDFIEANIICLANHAGCNITDQQLECSLEGIKGHIDGIIEPVLDDGTPSGKRYVVEVKSMSDASFGMFKRSGMSDKFGYVSQANSYAYALGLDGIVWVGQNKNNSMIHEEIREVNNTLALQTIDNIESLKACSDPTVFSKYDVEDETWYKKPTGNKILQFVCSTCSFVNECWDGCVKWERKGKIKHYAGDIKHGKWSEGGRVIT